MYRLNRWVGQWPLSRTDLQSLFDESGIRLDGITLNAGSGEYNYCLKAERIIGIDILPETKPTVVGDLQTIPLADFAVRNVLAVCVLEHVQTPQNVIREFHRILKINGLLVIEVPLINPVHGSPNDYFRFTIQGLGHLLTGCGFEILDTQITQPLLYGFAWSVWQRCKVISFIPVRWCSLALLRVLVKAIGLDRPRRFRAQDHSTYSQFILIAKKI